MPRVFWKFFIIVCVTLVITNTSIFSLVHFLEPFPPDRDQQQRELVLEQARAFLSKSGEAAARRFVETSEAVRPLGLKITKVAGECSPSRSNDTIHLAKDGACYTIFARGRQDALMEGMPFFLPWIAIFLSSVLAAAALAQYLIRPVVVLRDGLEALARGRFDIRIASKMASRKDEISALAQDFDVSASRLQELHDTQQRLFHDVSHELRSPLSRLQAVVGILRQGPGKLNAMLDRMDREVERLDVLVGEILTLAKLTTSTRLPIYKQNIDVIDLFHGIVEDAVFEAQTKGVVITGELEGQFWADVEGELLYRAFENILRNAVQYTAPNSQIAVRGDVIAEVLKVQVSDHGPGVAPGNLERIFQPFFRNTGDTPIRGYGLGLAIARQAIERHGGRVYAALPEGGGLAITFELPRQSETAAS